MTDEGVELGRRQLLDLVEVADGAVVLLDEWKNGHGDTVFTISLNTSGLERGPKGIEVQQRERFMVIIDSGFPFVPPSVYAAHTRWARTPHVQWGRSLCLYAATSVEWNPSDGMRGFIDRLSEWLDRAAAGTLDPDGQPLHPPAVASSSKHGTMLIHPDLGDRVPWATDGTGSRTDTLIAWCSAEPKTRRVDVLEWVSLAIARARAEGASADVFVEGLPVIAVAVVLMADEFGFEYPNDVKALSAGLTESGYDRDHLLQDLAATSSINRKLRAAQKAQDSAGAGDPWDDSDDDGRPLFTAMLVGTPSRRVEGNTRLAHLAAWRLDSLSSEIADLIGRARDLDASDIADEVRNIGVEYFETAKIKWMRVMETRSEVTRRGDQGTPQVG